MSLVRMISAQFMWMFLFSLFTLYAGKVHSCLSTVVLIFLSWGRLTGRSMVCPGDAAVFNCSKDYSTVIEWRISSTCGSGDVRRSFTITQHVGYTIEVTLCSTTHMFTVTSLTSSSISVTLTIYTPVLLNGTRISCGNSSYTLMEQ